MEAWQVNPFSMSLDSKPRRKRKRKRSNRFLTGVRRTWREWWVEILAALLILLAIFLLVERMNIRQTLWAWLVGLLDGLQSLVTSLIKGVGNLARNTTLSDLTAYVLLILVTTLIIWRTRRRLMTQPRFTESKCPRCNGDLHRIHRRWRDRVLNLFVPIRRYQCKNHDCGWRGLRVTKPRHQ